VNNENKITRIASRTIQIEIDVIEDLKASINQEFTNTVNAIYDCAGRVVLTGIGKSALIAQKITATLNSTGTHAVFMHASDAIHGDLGMIQGNDIVLCISKSGQTAEIKVLIPLIKRLGVLLIGMVSNKNSFLGRQADFILYTPVAKEADPNNLAPTASTTAQMVLGDALATSLLALRGFSTEDFAKFHPGGSLGKQLYLRIRDLYPKNEQPTIYPEATIQEVIIEITSRRLGATAVVDSKDQVLGIITDGDLRRMLKQHKDFSNLCAKDIMTKNPKCISADELAINGLNLMKSNSITQLIVVQQKNYVGIVHLHDLIREGLV